MANAAKLTPLGKGRAVMQRSLWRASTNGLRLRSGLVVPSLGTITKVQLSTSANTSPYTMTHISATGDVLFILNSRSNSGATQTLKNLSYGGMGGRPLVTSAPGTVGREWLGMGLVIGGPVGSNTMLADWSAGGRDYVMWCVDVVNLGGIGNSVANNLNSSAASIGANLVAQAKSLIVGAAAFGSGASDPLSLDAPFTKDDSGESGTGTSGGDIACIFGHAAGASVTFNAVATLADTNRVAVAQELMAA